MGHFLACFEKSPADCARIENRCARPSSNEVREKSPRSVWTLPRSAISLRALPIAPRGYSRTHPRTFPVEQC